MATLIPSLSTCKPRMWPGERLLAERLEQKLDSDYLMWFDVPIGPKQSRPDFVILHPRRGLLILEHKDWRLDTVRQVDRMEWTILDNNGTEGKPKKVVNPLEQARHCAIQVVNALERDKQLIQHTGSHQGKLLFPWGHGVVLTKVTRKQFYDAEWDQAIAPHRVICADEMQENCDPEEFQQRLWDMFSHAFGNVISLPQIDRVRWVMFPEIRTPDQSNLFTDEEAELPDIMRVMDLQQEQLARSLGDGHRIIHGVAGSGKTMILGYRAEHLAKASGANAKPILVLCFNEPLGVTLDAFFKAKGLSDKVHALHFHKWCRQQLVAFGQVLPRGEDMFDAMVDGVIRGVERKQIPAGQYQAILIDEGHDFKPHWLKLVTQMVDPTTNSLLVLYDDAQSIYERHHHQQFSFKSVGIQAQGRTTILKINYRNTKQILQIAHLIAADVLAPEEKDDDGIPLLKPISCGRDGEAPLIIRLPTIRDEAYKLAELLQSTHQEGFAWGDMAILCRDYSMINLCAHALQRKHMPFEVRKKSGDFKPGHDTIKVMTMKISKGLEFPVIALHGVGQMPLAEQDKKEQARIFYVAATRATNRLLITVSGQGAFGKQLAPIS